MNMNQKWTERQMLQAKKMSVEELRNELRSVRAEQAENHQIIFGEIHSEVFGSVQRKMHRAYSLGRTSVVGWIQAMYLTLQEKTGESTPKTK